MANQVVTIIDNNGNDIYPVAGALMQGAVTTSTINDNAVTAGKIDWGTVTSYHEIGRLEFTTDRVPNDTITLSESTKCIKIVAFGSPVANNASCQIFLNGDTGNHYSRRVMGRNGTDATTAWFEDNNSNLFLNFGSQPANSPCSLEAELFKTPGGWSGLHRLSGAYTGATAFRTGIISWYSTDDITSVNVSTTDSSSWKAGFTVIVYGHN